MSENSKNIKLYELSVLISYHVVVAATSKEDAKEHVCDWEDAWHSNADLTRVSDLYFVDVRPLKSVEVADEAHEVTDSARLELANREA